MADSKTKKSKTNNKSELPKQTNSKLVGNLATPVPNNAEANIGVDTSKKFIDNILSASIASSLDTAEIENFTSISNSRDQIYQMIDTMSQDSLIAAILKTYTENVCETNDAGHIV